MNILLLNGPNLNLLGEREPEIYGHTTLKQLEQLVAVHATERGASLRVFQSNHEGALLDKLHEVRNWAQGCVFNPGAYTHYAWSLRDAVVSIPKVKVVEVHISEPKSREAFRHVSVLDGVAAHRIAGKGIAGYLEAIEWLVQHK
ncbi:MAG: 3-dehydroquinate dehydratase [Deltaproteobacteria bacterium]|nr:3-dehydroquinate dehydratase [Deltaproteobacteria bacterium]